MFTYYKVEFRKDIEDNENDDWYDDDFLKGSVHYYKEDDNFAYSYYDNGEPFDTIISSPVWESFDDDDYTMTEITADEYNKFVIEFDEEE